MSFHKGQWNDILKCVSSYIGSKEMVRTWARTISGSWGQRKEVKLSEWWPSRRVCSAGRKGNPGTPDSPSLVKHKRGQGVGRKNTYRRDQPLSWNTSGFLCLTCEQGWQLQTDFRKPWASLREWVQRKFKKEKSGCFLWARYPGSMGTRRHTEGLVSCLLPPHLTPRYNPKPFQMSTFLEWKLEEHLFRSLINHLFFGGKSQKIISYFTVI